jgi:hypothetical protein
MQDRDKVSKLRAAGMVGFAPVVFVACFHLQSVSGFGNAFVLPTSPRIAQLFGTTPMTISNVLRRLQREEVIKCVDSHYSVEAGVARQFKLLVTPGEWLRQRGFN